MKYETLLNLDEKAKWLDLEVTIGTNEPLIEMEVKKLKKFLSEFDDLEITSLNGIIGTQLRLNSHFDIDSNPTILKLLLVKKFIDQHGLSIIREAKNSPNLSEKSVFIDIFNDYFTRGQYPEDIYVYSTYRQRGTPNTWFKIITNETADQIEAKIIDKTESVRRYINYHLPVNRKLRIGKRIGDLYLLIFSKAILPKVFKGENKNVEVQRSTYTIIVFDRTARKIGVVSGSKKEVQLIQRYIRYKIFKDSIAVPRQDYEFDKNELLKKIVISNPDRDVLLKGVSLQSTQLPGEPGMKLKIDGDETLDDALTNLEPIWSNLGIDALKSVDYQNSGKHGTVYLYGDTWKRMYINVSAKRHSRQFENLILDDLNERLGVNVKESRFLIEPLTDEYILERILSDKKVPTYPPVPEQVEKILVKLVSKKLIKKPTKMAKRKCQHCYSTTWEQWVCPSCGREDMTIVGELVDVKINETTLIRELAKTLTTDLSHHQISLYPYKQRRNYKKSVIRIHNPRKNLSAFVFLVSNKNDLPFAEDLLREGFGVIGLLDPNMSGKIDHIRNLGCDLVPLHTLLHKLIDNSYQFSLDVNVLNQEDRVLERVFRNLRTSVNTLQNKPGNYDEAMFEVDLKNILQAIVPDVIRLGTEYVGQKVPDGYCCYGFRGSSRKRKRLFGWDAKYSFSSHYRLADADLRKQMGYIKWLTDNKNEPYKMGSLGIYGFISNFNDSSGFETVLTSISTNRSFPNNCRLVLIGDLFLAKVGEWLIQNWQQFIDNNSLPAEEFFKFIRRKRPSKHFNTIGLSQWDLLKEKLDQSISSV